MKYHALFAILEKQQNLKLLSAANNRWRFMGSSTTIPRASPFHVYQTICGKKGGKHDSHSGLKYVQGSYMQVCVKFKDFLKTFLLFSRSENFYKILIYTLKYYFRIVALLYIK